MDFSLASLVSKDCPQIYDCDDIMLTYDLEVLSE